MIVSIYDPATGEITGTLASTNPESLEKALAGKSWIQGRWSGKEYRVVNGEVSAIPEAPVADGIKSWRWNPAAAEWQLDINKTTRQARNIRDLLLSAVDRVNPIWYASLNVEQQVQLQEYRLALLDVPQQPGFPENITWPAKPGWL